MSGLVTGEIRAYEGTRVHTYIVHIYVLAEMGACALNKVVHSTDTLSSFRIGGPRYLCHQLTTTGRYR